MTVCETRWIRGCEAIGKEVHTKIRVKSAGEAEFIEEKSISETPGRVQSPAPELGAHTDQVLQAVGYSTADLSSMRQRKII